MSVILFPADLDRWLPWMLCVAYGLTTPISIGIGLAVRNSYNAGSATSVSAFPDTTFEEWK